MSIINPKINADIIPASLQETAEDVKILFVGQKTSSGSAAAGSLVQSIGSIIEINAKFGEDSMIASGLRGAKKINKITRMDAIPLDDDGSAVAATATIVFAGTATSAGILYVDIGSKINNRYEIDVVNGDTATAVGGKLETAINNDGTSLVSAVNTTGSVALTAVNKGLEGDKIGIRTAGSHPGITITLSAMSGGATNPSLTNVFDVVGNIRYQYVVWPSTYDLDVLQGFLDGRFNSEVRILDGRALVSITDTLANLKTAGSAAARNSENILIHGNQLANLSHYKGSAIFETDYVIASHFMAIAGLRLTDGAPISQFVDATEGSSDAFGGIALASLPFFNTPFDNLPVIDNELQWLDSEIAELNDNGVFVLGNNIANNKIISDRVVTTYLTNSEGEKDITFKYFNYIETASAIRWYFHENLRNRFRQTRLTTGDIKSGRNMANAHIIQGAVMDYYKDLADLALLVAGEDARKDFLNNLTITINEAESKAVISMITKIVTQLEIIDLTMQIGFSTTE
jgi:phage tail sheath gpL-like